MCALKEPEHQKKKEQGDVALHHNWFLKIKGVPIKCKSAVQFNKILSILGIYPKTALFTFL
jgi:hypothetical protein